MTHDYTHRVSALQRLMGERGVDATLLSVGSDLPYFTGYTAMPTERLTMFVVPADGTPTMLVPELEGPRVEVGQFELVTWGETEDPVSLAAARVSSANRVAIGDHTWSVFLLGLQQSLGAVDWVKASSMTLELRMRKDRVEQEALRRVANQADRVAARIPNEISFAGSREIGVSRRIREMLVEEGHDAGEFAIVASGPNGASPHHEPGDREISVGDMIVIDFGGDLAGYKSDTTRSFVVGEASERQHEVHEVVRAANEAAKSVVSPGTPCQEVDRAARGVIESAGYGEFFIHRTGHGIGLEVHEHPYMVEGNDLHLEPGMTFSIEPGIYIPGEFGIRIEDIVLCNGEGADSLNQSNRALVEVT